MINKFMHKSAVRLGQRRQDLWQSFPKFSSEAAATFLDDQISRHSSSRMPLAKIRRIEASLPVNPLAGSHALPPIDLAVVAHPKDFNALSLVIEGAIASSVNEVKSVRVVIPTGAKPSIENAEILDENELFSPQIMKEIRDKSPDGRFGWILQQLLKFKISSISNEIGTLIVDADTVLTQQRVWVEDSGKQLLFPSHECHEPYLTHAANYWPDYGTPHGFSFVTHHQFMASDIVNAMFPEKETSLLKWISESTVTADSPVSEYHSYGTWLTNAFPKRVEWAQWGNRISFQNPEEFTLSSLRHAYRNANSVSFHSYLR